MEMKGGRLGNGEGRRRRSEDGDVEGERKEVRGRAGGSE